MALFDGIRELKDSISGSDTGVTIPDDYQAGPGDDHRFMARALKLAEKGVNTTHPNPRVGCVIVRNGVVVGEGYHKFAGEPHAEVHAIRNAGRHTQGGTLYVNLEPCCHTGRTPPCTDAIIRAGIVRVVIGMEDPNPQVNRHGLRALREAGIEVDSGINHERAVWLNRGFIRRVSEGRPWVTLKMASSLDGGTAMKNGESQWITSDPARQDAHRVRARHSAILTGIGTVLRDNPRMTARIPGVEHHPLRVILDSRLSTPVDAAILGEPGNVLIVTAPEHLVDADMFPQANVEIVSCPLKAGAIDLEQMLEELGRREINYLMLEAGATLSGSMLGQGLVDEMIIYVAPDVLGSDARGMFRLPGMEHIVDKRKLEFRDVRRIGRDMRLSMLAVR